VITAAERSELRREVLRQSWPLVLQNLSRTFMFFVDTLMIGRVGRDAMAAMGVVGPVSHTLVSVLTALSVGAIATVARAWGERDRARQESEAATAAVLALLAGVPLSLLGVLLLPEAARLLPVDGAPAVGPMAGAFLRFEGAALLFVCLDLAASGILRGAGATRVTMAAGLLANALNVLLNWVFIYGNLGAPAMGVAGAGLATAVSMSFQGLLLFGFLWTPLAPIRLRLSTLRAVGAPALARLARITVPAALEPLLLQAGFLLYTRVITALGAPSMAAHRVALAVESLTFMGGYGFVMAGSALVGQSLGEGRPDKAEAALRACARLATYSMSAAGVAFLLFSPAMVALFVPGPEREVAALAAACMAIAGIEQPFMALAMSLAGGLRGAGDTRSPVAVGAIGVWLVRVPAAWALAFPMGLGLHGIWMTMILDWAVRAAVFSVIVRRAGWKTLRL
jgi:putative MATE family efflux protein